MKIDKIKLLIIQLSLIVFLFLAVFVSSIKIGNILTSIFLVTYTVIVIFLIKKKAILSLYQKEVAIVMFSMAAIYLLLFYLLGIFLGFGKSAFPFRWSSLYHNIIPFIIIVISSELVRAKFLTQDIPIRIGKKKINVAKILTFIIMVLIDLLLYAKAYNLSNAADFLAAFGYILFASISTNLLYNYITIRFGSKGIIIYRLITLLYIYIIPIVPNVYIFFKSFARMIYPYIIYLYLENSYAKASFAVAYKDKKKNIVSTTITIVISTILIMLISCKFTYGLIVVGTGSMTGTINMGDVVFFKQYKSQILKPDDIIIFRKDNKDVVHRIIDIKSIDGERQYYTKGDANDNVDSGYRTDETVWAIVKFRIPVVGYPNIWFRRLFNN